MKEKTKKMKGITFSSSFLSAFTFLNVETLQNLAQVLHDSSTSHARTLLLQFTFLCYSKAKGREREEGKRESLRKEIVGETKNSNDESLIAIIYTFYEYWIRDWREGEVGCWFLLKTTSANLQIWFSSLLYHKNFLAFFPSKNVRKRILPLQSALLFSAGEYTPDLLLGLRSKIGTGAAVNNGHAEVTDRENKLLTHSLANRSLKVHVPI